ncbi:MAG: GAF domain-containing protein, partial [Alphaproteobacteria bacterium]
MPAAHSPARWSPARRTWDGHGMARPAKNRRAPLPQGEAERLAALQGCAILDTAPDPRFDRISRIAAATFAAPIAGIAFVDADRLWLKSALGTAAGERIRDLALGAHVILTDAPTLVADASRDRRFRHFPAVTGTPGVRFYAAAPLAVGGQRIGCLFVADSAPRTPTPGQVHVLEDLAALVVDELELGLGQGYAAERAVAAKALADADREAARLRGIVERASQEIYTCDAHSLRFLNANRGARENLGYT